MRRFIFSVLFFFIPFIASASYIDSFDNATEIVISYPSGSVVHNLDKLSNYSSLLFFVKRVLDGDRRLIGYRLIPAHIVSALYVDVDNITKKGLCPRLSWHNYFDIFLPYYTSSDIYGSYYFEEERYDVGYYTLSVNSSSIVLTPYHTPVFYRRCRLLHDACSSLPVPKIISSFTCELKTPNSLEACKRLDDPEVQDPDYYDCGDYGVAPSAWFVDAMSNLICCGFATLPLLLPDGHVNMVGLVDKANPIPAKHPCCDYFAFHYVETSFNWIFQNYDVYTFKYPFTPSPISDPAVGVYSKAFSTTGALVECNLVSVSSGSRSFTFTAQDYSPYECFDDNYTEVSIPYFSVYADKPVDNDTDMSVVFFKNYANQKHIFNDVRHISNNVDNISDTLTKKPDFDMNAFNTPQYPTNIIVPEKKNISSLVNSFFSNSPFSFQTDFYFVNSYCSLSSSVFGRSVSVSFCSPSVIAFFDLIGHFVVLIATLTFFYIVFRG